MIAAGSLIGFALAGLVATWVASFVLATAVLAARRALRRAGPGAERAAATQALLLPPVLGLTVVVALAAAKLVPLLGGGDDHCGSHPHHLHLCLVHGGDWAGETWAVVVLAAAAALVAAAASTRGSRILAVGRTLRAVRRRSRPLAGHADVYIAPSEVPFTFVAGPFRPAVYVASCVWECLDAAERRALVAHERAHADRGDVFKRSALDLLALLGAPWLTFRVRDLWAAATERLRDADAAAAIGDPVPVARALVHVARLQAAHPVGAAAFAPHRDELADRVESVLSGVGPSRRPRWVLATALSVATLAVTVAIGFSDPLHHLLESLLGSF